MNRQQFGAALGTALLAPTVFALTGPTVVGLREQAKDPIARKHLRSAQYIGAAAVLGVGFATGVLMDDKPYLVVGAAVGAVGMFLLYEAALRHPKPDAKEQTTQSEPRTVLVY